MSQSEAVDQFRAITSLDTETCRAFLEAANWNVEEATGNFLDGNYPPPPPKPSQAAAAPASRSASARSGGIRTLSDMRSGDEDQDEQETETYFTGGEKSGLQVQAPKSDKEHNNKLVTGVFDSAKKQGALSDDQWRAQEKDESKFGGTGFRLGTGMAPSQAVEHSENRPKQVTRKVTFWKNGFSVDDGDLRKFDDPANQKFMEDINAGIAPAELGEAGQDVRIELVDNRFDNYIEKKRAVKAFTGSGQRLGGGDASPIAGSTPAPASVNAPATAALVVDGDKPTTTIQIRLHDGGKHATKANHTHTVGDLYGLAAGLSNQSNFDLMTTFPRKVLTDKGQSVADAGLLNAVVVQNLR